MYIKVHVIPDSRKEKVVKDNETTYRIQVKEPAERNMANTRIREILCAEFGLEKGKVRMITGHHSGAKIFDVELE